MSTARHPCQASERDALPRHGGVRGEEGNLPTLPDDLGNHLFDTLGKLVPWPHARLALRLLPLRVRHGWWRPEALPLAWSAAQPAPQFAQARFQQRFGPHRRGRRRALARPPMAASP